MMLFTKKKKDVLVHLSRKHINLDMLTRDQGVQDYHGGSTVHVQQAVPVHGPPLLIHHASKRQDQE